MTKAATGALLVAAGLFAVFAITQLSDASNGQPDFPNYYFAGERLLEGGPVYDDVAPDVMRVFGKDDYPVYAADPPATVTALSPLSLMPYDVAWWGFAALIFTTTLAVVYLTARELDVSRSWAVMAVALAIVSTNFRFLILRNHLEALILLLGFLGWRGLRHGKSGGAGAIWGLAAALKLFPAMWMVGLAGARRWKALLWAAVVAGGASFVGVALVGWEESWRFVTEIVPRSDQWYGTLGNYSLLSFGTALVDVWLGWVLVAGALVTLVPWYVRSPGGPDRIWAAGTALALLLSPLAWHNYMILTFPALIMLGAKVDLRQPKVLLGYTALVGALGFWGPVVFASELVTVLVSFVPTYALVALFVTSMRLLDREDYQWQSTSVNRSPISA